MNVEGFVQRPLGTGSRRLIREEISDDTSYDYDELSTSGDELEFLRSSSPFSSSSDGYSEYSGSPITRSVASNVLFFVGSVFYVIQAVWDLNDVDDYDDDLNDADGDSYDSYGDDTLWNLYNIVVMLAACTYVLSALNQLHGLSLVWTTENQGDLVNELVPVVLFGIAALLEFAGVLLEDDEHPQAEYTASAAAVHVYLLEAIISLWGEKFSTATVTLGLLTAGNLLFFFGCVIDVIISYMSTPDTPNSALHMMSCWSLISAVLWLVDSIFYLIAGCPQLRYPGRTSESQSPLQLPLTRNDGENHSDDENQSS